MEKVLFVTEKWCDGSPNSGFTNNFHNLFSSFRNCYPQININTLHIDEASVSFGTHVDDILVDYCEKFEPDTIFFSLLGDSPLNPTVDTFLRLKEKKIKLCFKWPDTGPGWACSMISNLKGIADLHVSWDQPVSDFHSSLQKSDNHLFLWAPQDENLYRFKEIKEKSRQIAFLGRPFLQRGNDLMYLKSKMPYFHFGGGQREQKLSCEQYASEVADSKIIINFPNHALGFSQLKSRVIESIICGSVVLERKNESTSRLFEPFSDYIEYKSLDEAVEKAEFYLASEGLLQEIANKARAKYLENYSAKKYWDLVVQNL